MIRSSLRSPDRAFLLASRAREKVAACRVKR